MLRSNFVYRYRYAAACVAMACSLCVSCTNEAAERREMIARTISGLEEQPFYFQSELLAALNRATPESLDRPAIIYVKMGLHEDRTVGLVTWLAAEAKVDSVGVSKDNGWTWNQLPLFAEEIEEQKETRERGHVLFAGGVSWELKHPDWLLYTKALKEGNCRFALFYDGRRVSDMVGCAYNPIRPGDTDAKPTACKVRLEEEGCGLFVDQKADGKLLRTWRLEDGIVPIATRVEKWRMVSSRTPGRQELLIELAVNPALGVAIVLDMKTGGYRVYHGLSFTWNSSSKTMAYYQDPPHFGSPAGAKSAVYVAALKVHEMPRGTRATLAWKEGALLVNGVVVYRSAANQPPKAAPEFKAKLVAGINSKR